jgi:hypothetical protein
VKQRSKKEGEGLMASKRMRMTAIVMAIAEMKDPAKMAHFLYTRIKQKESGCPFCEAKGYGCRELVEILMTRFGWKPEMCNSFLVKFKELVKYSPKKR